VLHDFRITKEMRKRDGKLFSYDLSACNLQSLPTSFPIFDFMAPNFIFVLFFCFAGRSYAKSEGLGENLTVIMV
jgi:hypothetical protein